MLDKSKFTALPVVVTVVSKVEIPYRLGGRERTASRTASSIWWPVNRGSTSMRVPVVNATAAEPSTARITVAYSPLRE